ncbi:MAG: hypothetical protein IKY90_01435 [Oscillospiraceae bacterium]|jgi:hypothetical protein|nr:hypothetical protein [Oscillospiraceae bacterium]
MAKLTIESTIKELLANKEVKAKIEELIPGLTKNPILMLAKNETLKDIIDKVDDFIDDETIDKIIDFLKDLKENN